MAYLLLVDDDQDFVIAAATVLRNAGHEVHVENDTAAALKSLDVRCPDLVILDVMFPEDAGGGFEMARAMRHYMDRFKNIPILMLTAVNSRFPLGFSGQDIDDTWLPVSDFLEKPLDLALLPQRVEALLKKASQDKKPEKGI